MSTDVIVKINAKRSNLHVAPEGIIFEVTLKEFDASAPRRRQIYDQRLHEIYYVWDFGDPDNFTAPVNTFAEHKNGNVAFGPVVSHTFKKPGTYTVSVKVVEPSSGKTASATYKVITGNPDTFFGKNATLFVDATGNYSGAPAGSVGYTSFNAAVAAVDGVGAPRRIMLRRGQSFPVSSYRFRGSFDNLLCCSQPGAGAKAELVWQPNSNGRMLWIDNVDARRTKDFIFENLKFRGPWDSTVEAGDGGATGLYIFNDGPSYMLINQCEFTGFSVAVGIYGDVDKNNVFVMNDTLITNWRDYGFYVANQGYMGLTGCRITQHIDALSGGPKDGAHNNHGPIRVESGHKFTIDACDLFSRNGWFENIPGYRTPQPCLRWNQSGTEGAFANITRCSAEGGYEVLDIERRDGGLTPRRNNAIIDSCILVGNAMSSSIILIGYGGTTVRNCIMIHPNVVRDISGIYNPTSFVRLKADGNGVKELKSPIRIYNNTMISFMTDTNWHTAPSTTAEFTNNGFKDVIVENNVIHQPNLGMPQTPDAPIDLTPVFQPRHKGYVSQQKQRLRKQDATPTNSAVSASPLSGSAALGAADEDIASIYDFLGRWRPAYPSRGAFEMPH
jgi:hypothetical protein